ncbi:MAG TPA: DUF421 domain-containing protein [Candidatus Scatovivens faecipullorum]|nr:DUF421 domain-containing protein [Candidatus Scatovivens faecipullorum]
MILIFVRTIIIYVLVLFVMRFMGKREIGQMQPFELVISIMIADLASTPMAEIGIPILYGIIPIFGLLFMHILISVLNIKSIRVREIICGKPRILINEGNIDEKALTKENFTINELQERLRVNNVNNISDVEYAILETSGQISVILKSEKRGVTTEDLKLQVAKTKISYDLVLDGKIMYDNLKKIGKDEKWLVKEIQKFKIRPQQALIFVQNGDGSFFCQEKQEK